MTEPEFRQCLAAHASPASPWPRRILSGQQFLILGLVRQGMNYEQAVAWLEAAERRNNA